MLLALAVAASTGTGAAKAGEASASAQGGKRTNTIDSLLLGHSKVIAADTQLVNSGKVLEVLNTDMYTYLQVTTEKGPLWIAAYKTDVTKGATVRYSNGVAMSNFYSNALNRNFDVIVFVDSLEQVKK
jgi:hypothetical protein